MTLTACSKNEEQDDWIDSDLSENCQTISPDGKYLFFVGYDGEKESSNDYWVSIDVILELKDNLHEETKVMR